MWIVVPVVGRSRPGGVLRAPLLVASLSALACNMNDEGGSLYVPELRAGATGVGGNGGGSTDGSGGVGAAPDAPGAAAAPSSAGRSGEPGEAGPDPSGVAGAGPTSEPGAGSTPATSSDAGPLDAGPLDAGRFDGGRADPDPVSPCVLGSFDEPAIVVGLGLDESLNLWAPALSPDGLTLYFTAQSAEADEDLYAASRPDRNSSFSPATPLASVNSDSADGSPFPAPDDAALFFYSTRPGGQGSRDLWRVARTGPGDDFGTPEPLASLITGAVEHLATLSADGLTMLFVSTRGGGLGSADIWRATRASLTDDFELVDDFVEINSAEAEGRAQLAADGLSVYFASRRPGTVGGFDLWVATRGAPSDAFSSIENLSALNGPNQEVNLAVSSDEREIFFSSDRSGQPRLMRATRDCE